MEYNDPVNPGIKPSREERYTAYRNGEVVTVSFDTDEAHLCYGVNNSGNVWDFHYHNAKENLLVFYNGLLNSEKIAHAQKLIKDLNR